MLCRRHFFQARRAGGVSNLLRRQDAQLIIDPTEESSRVSERTSARFVCMPCLHALAVLLKVQLDVRHRPPIGLKRTRMSVI